jgi:hypothetical protein
LKEKLKDGASTNHLPLKMNELLKKGSLGQVVSILT